MRNLIQATISLDNGTKITLDTLTATPKDGGTCYTADISNIPELDVFAVSVKPCGAGVGVWVEVETLTTTCRTSYGLSHQNAVELVFALETAPQQILDIYHFNDWWTRPAFPTTIADLKPQTAYLLLQEGTTHRFVMTLCGSTAKSEIEGSDKGLVVKIGDVQAGVSKLYDMVLCMAVADKPSKAIDAAFAVAFEQLPQKPLRRAQKRVPEMFEYLGWCSWDAFYTKVHEAGLLDKGQEFQDKHIPVKWMIIDDGWMQSVGDMVTDYNEDPEKFPSGFAALTAKLQTYGVENVGVWHTLGGYWGGIAPESPLHKQQRCYLSQTPKGKVLPDLVHGFRFWRDWYRSLHAKGISFVKVDGQSALHNYYRAQASLGDVAPQAHDNIEGAINTFFDGRVINCMGMSAENIWNRQNTAVARTSDDFVPQHEQGFADHLMQNVYNSLYHGQLYTGDWDMFWTDHFDARRHAMLRAVSGGPIYFSDKVGGTAETVIAPLVYQDGRVTRCDLPGLPAESCMYTDPTTCHTPIKVVNRVGENGVIAVFALSEEGGEVSVAATDCSDLSADTYLLFNQSDKRCHVLPKGQSLTMCLKGYQADCLTLVPLQSGVTPIGLVEKYVSCHAVVRHMVHGQTSCTVLREAGLFGFYASHKPVRIEVNGASILDKLSQHDTLYTLDIPQTNGEVEVWITLP